MNNKLSEFRNSKNLSQQEMANKLGITWSFYSKVELGFRNPSFNFMTKLKENFDDADVNEIFFKH